VIGTDGLPTQTLSYAMPVDYIGGARDICLISSNFRFQPPNIVH